VLWIPEVKSEAQLLTVIAGLGRNLRPDGILLIRQQRQFPAGRLRRLASLLAERGFVLEKQTAPASGGTIFCARKRWLIKCDIGLTGVDYPVIASRNPLLAMSQRRRKNGCDPPNIRGITPAPGMDPERDVEKVPVPRETGSPEPASARRMIWATQAKTECVATPAPQPPSPWCHAAHEEPSLSCRLDRIRFGTADNRSRATALTKRPLLAFCEWQIGQGIAALVVAGTTGEAPTLSMVEHRRLVRIAAETADGRVPVVAGTGANATAHAIELARQAEQEGADGLLVVTP